jgi:hypothetical protein
MHSSAVTEKQKPKIQQQISNPEPAQALLDPGVREGGAPTFRLARLPPNTRDLAER